VYFSRIFYNHSLFLIAAKQMAVLDNKTKRLTGRQLSWADGLNDNYKLKLIAIRLRFAGKHTLLISFCSRTAIAATHISFTTSFPNEFL